MKPKTQSSKIDRLILEEASEWFVDFRVGDVDKSSRERFDIWLRQSPEHIRAYIGIAKTYVELPPHKGASPLDVDSLIAYAHSGENVVPFKALDSLRPHGSQSTPAEHGNREPTVSGARRAPRTRIRFRAVAACALILMIGGAVWWQTEHFPSYATDIGERRSITLTDGSTVDLNARSKLRVEFSKDQRRVELLRGQALFQVAKDKSRPFIVASREATVRAVGTQFDVNLKADGTTVTVLEGRVAVYSAGHSRSETSSSAQASSEHAQAAVSSHAFAPLQSTQHPLSKQLSSGTSVAYTPNPPGLTDPLGSDAIFVSAGEQVTMTPSQVPIAPAHADIAANTAWMQRRLVFDGWKLSDVVEEFNRNNKRQLVVVGAQLSDFHVSGVYSSSDSASLIRFLRDQPGIKITETDKEVRINVP